MNMQLFILAASVCPVSHKTEVGTCDGRRVLRHTPAGGIHAYLNQNWVKREQIFRYYYLHLTGKI